MCACKQLSGVFRLRLMIVRSVECGDSSRCTFVRLGADTSAASEPGALRARGCLAEACGQDRSDRALQQDDLRRLLSQEASANRRPWLGVRLILKMSTS